MDTLDKILLLLKQRGMSEIEFVQTVGLYKTAVTDWKSGKTKSYNKHLPKIAEALGVTPEELLNNNKGRKTSQIILDYMAGRNISAYKVSQGTGISQGTFSKWRATPTSNITTEVLQKIADYLSVPVSELIGETDEHKKKAPPTLKEAEEAYVRALSEHGYLKKGKVLTAEEMERLRRAAQIALMED